MTFKRERSDEVVEYWRVGKQRIELPFHHSMTPSLQHSTPPLLKKVAACLRRPPETKPKELKNVTPEAQRIPAEVR